MKNKEKFALVPAPPTWLEKFESGTKRVLSCMVSDTLALAQNGAIGKPLFTVLIGHRNGLGDVWEMFLKFEIGQKYELRFLRFGDDLGFDSHHAAELLSLAATQPFDLIMAYCSNGASEIELFARLKAQYGKPIIVTHGRTADEMAPFERAGIKVLDSCFLIEDFRRALLEANIP